MSGPFAILSDLHIGVQGMLPDGKEYGDYAALSVRAVEEILRRDIKQVVLLGDIVNRGYPEEYAQAKKVFSPIADRIIPVCGNHELQRGSILDFARHWGCDHFSRQRIGGIESILLNSGIEDLPDTQWHGRLDGQQLSWLAHSLDEIGQRPLLLFIHHPLRDTVRHSDRPMLFLENSDEVMALLRTRRSPTIVFSGHNHASSIVRGDQLTFVGCPSLGFWPHAFVLAENGGGALSLSTIQVHDRLDDSPDAGAIDPSYRAHRQGCDTDLSGSITIGG
jgi:3',5'-cyclic AMP phosphodiesterase CpdA